LPVYHGYFGDLVFVHLCWRLGENGWGEGENRPGDTENSFGEAESKVGPAQNDSGESENPGLEYATPLGVFEKPAFSFASDTSRLGIPKI
jgi:hypothetical protein